MPWPIWTVIKLVTAVAVRSISGSWPRFGHEGPIVILIAIVISTPFQAGEEVGWRGYALPRIATRIGYARASLVIGVIWALWHLPLFFLQGADKYGQSFPVWSLGVTALSVAITWLYAHTNGSLLLTMLMHSAVNQTLGIVPSASLNASRVFSLHASTVMWLTNILMCAAALFFLARMPGFVQSERQSTESPREAAAGT
ncbi:MAG TPA: CPBP family intramembrane glutamic endopeptidase [Terriglobales bacterium]|nr:CPBP family intramembrane glutamic endopeptidase [Terriglobales bacterium]